ncbi:MAG: phosphatase PAP2 family protein [Spirochaetes bacterium]|nr:phosphatase PAP2 family protein [Spirochaetota bacterium]
MEKRELNGIFFPTDISILITSFIFSIYSILNFGKIKINFLNIKIDRGLFYSIVFIILIIFQIIFIKLTNNSKNRFIRFFRFFYPQAFYIIFFNECITLSQLFYNNKSLDKIFADIDYIIFHYQPALHLFKDFYGVRWVNELFFFSYFFYYFMITSGWWFLYLRKKEKQAQFGLWLTTTSFCFLYIFYVIFPVKGPKFYFSELNQLWYEHFKGYFFTNLMKKIFNTANLGGAAFPSSHVAISLIALLLNRKLNRWLIPLYFPFTVTLFLSTIYIYAHYFVDILGGIFFGIILYEYVPLLYKYYEKLNEIFSKYFTKFIKIDKSYYIIYNKNLNNKKDII